MRCFVCGGKCRILDVINNSWKFVCEDCSSYVIGKENICPENIFGSFKSGSSYTESQHKVLNNNATKFLIDEECKFKDIVVMGTLSTWEVVNNGQRISQMIKVWKKQGHRILYVEPYATKNKSAFEDNQFKLLCYQEDGIWNWWQNHDGPKKNIEQRKANLIKVLNDWQKPDNQPIVIYEMPLPDHIELLDVFIERKFKIVYDLIDKWDGMHLGDKIRIPKFEKELVDKSGILIASSKMLVKELMNIGGSTNPNSCRQDVWYIPNAGDPSLFDLSSVNSMPEDMENSLRNGKYDKIIFYMGPVQCEWFDWQSYLSLLKAYPNYKFVCIGWNCERDNFKNSDYALLKEMPNFAFLGMKKHTECKNYIKYADVCIIPFRDIPMIHATSPNKLFEYLICYKPVLNVYSNETKNYPYVFSAKKGEWVQKLKEAANCKIDKSVVDTFLKNNTWEIRANKFLYETWTCHQKEFSKIQSSRGYINWSLAKVKMIPDAEKKKLPLCSIIMLNMNSFEYTEQAVLSINHNTAYPFELIMVDNGSTDDEKSRLENLKNMKLVSKIIYNGSNLGFAGGNNKGIEAAAGQFLCFINNDVIAGPNWLDSIMACFNDASVGAVGPVSNNVGSETFPQRVQYINEKDGIKSEIQRLSGFCMVIRKKAFDNVGKWDEAFYPGNFEDDDMCCRLIEKGWKLLYTGDSFVHHKMLGTYNIQYNRLDNNQAYARNKLVFESKWKNKYPAVVRYDKDGNPIR